MTFRDHLTKNVKDLIKIPGLKRTRRASEKVGLPPGALVHVGEQKTDRPFVRLVDYNQDQLSEIEVDSIEQCVPFKESDTVTWIEVFGLHDISLIEKIGNLFALHPLVLEDILNTNQRPKIEAYEDFLFICLKNLIQAKSTGIIAVEQISIVIGKGYVISFHEQDNQLFSPVLNRLRNAKLRIRSREADYLAYALIDTIVDHYFLVMEDLGEKLEELDTISLQDLSQQHLETLFSLKKCLMLIRKTIWPLREMIDGVLEGEYELISESTLLFYRDVKDHLHQVFDSLESYRETASSAVDTHLSVLSMKMNEVMKVLTIAATIFMPLTFVVGIYGMNFNYMPELEWRWGYFFVLGIMGAMIVGLLVYFRKKHWI